MATTVESAVLHAIALASTGRDDEALYELIEDGVLTPDQHIASDDYLEALEKVEEEYG